MTEYLYANLDDMFGEDRREAEKRGTKKVAADWKYQAIRYLFTYAGHLDKKRVEEFFKWKAGERGKSNIVNPEYDTKKMVVLVAHEEMGSIVRYRHTHVYVDFLQVYPIRKGNYMDHMIDGVMPHIRPAGKNYEGMIRYVTKEDLETRQCVEGQFPELKREEFKMERKVVQVPNFQEPWQYNLWYDFQKMWTEKHHKNLYQIYDTHGSSGIDDFTREFKNRVGCEVLEGVPTMGALERGLMKRAMIQKGGSLSHRPGDINYIIIISRKVLKPEEYTVLKQIWSGTIFGVGGITYAKPRLLLLCTWKPLMIFDEGFMKVFDGIGSFPDNTRVLGRIIRGMMIDFDIDRRKIIRPEDEDNEIWQCATTKVIWDPYGFSASRVVDIKRDSQAMKKAIDEVFPPGYSGVMAL